MDISLIGQTAARVVLGIIILIGFGIFFGLLYKGIDRKVSAHMQGRIGPQIQQPFRDVVKLFTKENIVPENAIPWVFHLAPLLGLVAAISILLYIPIGGFAPVGQIEDHVVGDLILILYLLILPSLALVIGGFASGSPYATVGAQREMATMIAYEFPLAIIIVTLAWRLSQAGITNAFSLTAIAATPIWGMVGPLGLIGAILLLLTLIIVTPAELSKVPFDAPEAETEIGGGLLVEYSGRNLAMFYLTDSVKTVVMSAIIVVLFFPYNITSFILTNQAGQPIGLVLDLIFFLIKLLIVIIVSVSLIRVAVARLKIDQIVYTYWVPLTLMALVGLICIMWDWQIISESLFNWEWYQPIVSYLGFV